MSGVWEYIQEVRDLVSDLESRLQRAKDHVEEILSCMRSWATPMFDRKEGKKEALLSLEDRTERLDRFYGLIRSSGEKVHFLLKVLCSSLSETSKRQFRITLTRMFAEVLRCGKDGD